MGKLRAACGAMQWLNEVVDNPLLPDDEFVDVETRLVDVEKIMKRVNLNNSWVCLLQFANKSTVDDACMSWATEYIAKRFGAEAVNILGTSMPVNDNSIYWSFY